MQYRELCQNSGLKVSTIALGTMSVAAGSMHAEIDERRAIETIRAAIDAGVNFIDTAPAYGSGESEERLGRALADGGIPRDSVILATKASGSTLSRDEILADCDSSLTRLRTSYIDLYQIHWRRSGVPLEETLEAMQTLKRHGKIRAIGVCNFGPADLADAAVATNEIVSDQVAYSLLSRGPEFGLQAACQQYGIGILCYSPLAQGLLTGAYRAADDVPADRRRSRHFAGSRAGSRHGESGCERELFEAIGSVRKIADREQLSMADLAIAWLLHQPCVSSILCGASTPEQARANVRAADIRLSADVLSQLDAATTKVKTHLGSNMDLWQGSSNTRIH
jgi:myo-inositol catabolism protein IolS